VQGGGGGGANLENGTSPNTQQLTTSERTCAAQVISSYAPAHKIDTALTSKRTCSVYHVKESAFLNIPSFTMLLRFHDA
jgi:hypothetical protein